MFNTLSNLIADHTTTRPLHSALIANDGVLDYMVDALPRSPIGRVLKRALRDGYLRGEITV